MNSKGNSEVKSAVSSVESDVLIVGAGASGLAAAAALSNKGLKVTVLEARERVGGRILTVREPGLGCPIELGAEFVHGKPKETFDIIESAGLSAYDIYDHHDQKTPAGLIEAKGYWERISSVMEKLDANRQVDRSFRDFLNAHCGEFNRETNDLALAFAEGFHAAPTDELSEKGLAQAEQATNNADVTKAFRIFEGYDRVVERLLLRLQESAGFLRLGRVVEKISWSAKPGVSIEARCRFGGDIESYIARQAIITLPIGVLRTREGEPGGVAINPRPKSLEVALDALRMGCALRVVLRFRRAVWNDVREEPFGYLHASPNAAFPVWWTSMPVRAPLITAWAGGPQAQRLSLKQPSELVEIAIATLADILSIPIRELKRELQTAHYHDWINDPLTRGSYSFIHVGGAEACRRLSDGFDNTLYFAGEGTHAGSARGTVDGAIATGYRAAELLLRSMNKR